MSRRIAAAAVAGSAALLGACAGGGGATGETVTASPVVTTVTSTSTSANTVAGASQPATVTVTATSSGEPAGNVCDPAQFYTDFTEPVVLFCDGQWARAGQKQTDHVLLFRHTGDLWQEYGTHGEMEGSGYGCYDEARLRADGAPEELVGQALLCQ